MTVQTDNLGGRLPLTDPASLTGAQREVFDLMMSTMVPWANQAPFQSTTADGRFIGPFNPALINPRQPPSSWSCNSPSSCTRPWTSAFVRSSC
jgi:4-carboxymuconolactone decarboxylase